MPQKTAVDVHPVATDSTDVKIALDPKAFKELFGPAAAAAGVVDATPEDLVKLRSYANENLSGVDRKTFLDKLARCINEAVKCIVEPTSE